MKREKGRRGTRTTYRVSTSGFAPDKTYKMLFSSLAIPKPSVMLSGILVDETGSLVSGKTSSGQTVQLSKFTWTIEDYNKGEYLRVEIVSEDGSVYAVDELFPFPIEARDGPCHLWAAMVTKDRKAFAIIGRGFGPNSEVRTASSEDGGKDLKEGPALVGSNDLFGAGVEHRNRGGIGTFVAVGQSCQVTLQYQFGRQAKGPQ